MSANAFRARRRPAVAEPDRAPEIRHGVPETRVERRIDEGRVDVDAVRDLGVVQRQQHVGRDHALDIVVGRKDHVVAGIAAAELGEQLVVAGVQVVADRDPGRVAEILDRRLTDVGVPVVDVDLRRLREALPAERRQRGGDGAGAGEETATVVRNLQGRAGAAGHHGDLGPGGGASARTAITLRHHGQPPAESTARAPRCGPARALVETGPCCGRHDTVKPLTVAFS